jgi:hypothetical protein
MVTEVDITFYMYGIKSATFLRELINVNVNNSNEMII